MIIHDEISQKEQIKPFIPFYNRPPCKAIEYWCEEFDDGAGHRAKLKHVKFFDKGKNEKDLVIQVIWY